MPVFELASGTIDGVNRVFTTSTDFKLGSLVAILNGQKLVNQITELTSNSFEFPADNTPRVGDVVAAYYVAI